MTTVQIHIADQQAAALSAYARAHGLTIEQCVVQLVEQAAPVEQAPTAVDDRPIWEIFADDMKDVPHEDLALLPKDGAAQIDHYLYGQPKA